MSLHRIQTGKLFHDENVFENADSFMPERYFEHPDLVRTVEYVFGGGRVCPYIVELGSYI
jgi:cytochrome P450